MENKRTISKHLSRGLLLFLALLFIFEAWLWEQTGRLIAWFADHIPLKKLKHAIELFLGKLSPIATLGVFIIPAMILFPLKLFAMWLFAKDYLLGGLGLTALAKILGLGVSSFLFDRCKPKLLQLGWVRWVYEHLIYLYTKATQFIRPYKESAYRYIKKIKALLPERKAWRVIERLRSKIKKAYNE